MTPNPPETPTPQTDAFFAKMKGFPHEMLDQMTEHSRTLELETIALRAALEAFGICYNTPPLLTDEAEWTAQLNEAIRLMCAALTPK